ncbi:hypothetical protein [Devosia sp.]|uniref:hypothetical protein n=1 Tax=Devosia sp. TaxID=1871048 RepID=UPI00262F41D7|nr:hypothetical protein [Devosia sp.]
MTDRYFDETLQAWVTVCRPGAAKGILTADGFRGARAAGWGAAKSAAAQTRAWDGVGKRGRKKRQH